MTAIVDFLAGLDETQRHSLEDRSRLRRYPKGSLLVAEGDDAHEVLVITSGAVKVLVTAPDGKQVVLDVLERGALLGELAAIDGERRSATAIALTPVEVLVLAQGNFRRLVEESPALAAALLELLASRLRGSAQRQLELGATDALGRVCRRLAELAERYGHVDDRGRTAVSAPLTQQDLAEWAGLSREAVVKALRSLRALGWVEIRGRHVLIVDLDAVAARALA